MRLHKILAELCPFENSSKCFAAFCLEVLVCKFNFIVDICLVNNLSYGHMGKLFIYLFFFHLYLLDLQGNVAII